MRIAVINYSDPQFKKGQDRLVQSLKDQNFNGDVILYNNVNQLWCKPHVLVPYQFKVYAINKAYNDGYDLVLYCDASIWAIKNIQPVFDYIKENGHLLEYCGYTLGQYCSDTALNEFGISRDDAFNIQLHSAGFTGLNFRNPLSETFIKQWYEYAVQEKTFIGDWNNNNKQVSSDSRCLGHRHDQSVASFLAHKLQMKRINPTFMQYHFDNVPIKDETFFLARGI